MFAKLSKQVDALQKDIRDIKEKKEEEVSRAVIDQCKAQIIEEIANSKNFENPETIEIKKELKYVKFKNRALINVVQSMSVEMEDLRSRMDNVEINTSKLAITLSGFKLSEEEKDGSQKLANIVELEDFFEASLGLIVTVEDFFRLGTILVIFLQTMQQKRDILKFKSLLKGVRGDFGRPMYINDYLPNFVQEKRRREREILASIDESTTTSYNKGRLVIQGEIYRPKIEVPTAKQIVDHSADEIERILKLKMCCGKGKVIQDRSIFEGFTACVNDYKTIRDLYTYMKLLYPSARHIVCAYWIEGPDHLAKSFCDDGEPGAGRALLNMLVKHGFKSRVIFVTRVFGGIKMGSNRFDCYRDAGKDALINNAWNDVEKIEQRFKKDDFEPQKEDQQSVSGDAEQERRMQVKRPASQPPCPRVRHESCAQTSICAAPICTPTAG